MTASPYKGVYSTKNKLNPWMVRIQENGKDRYLGVFKTAGEAAAAARAARKALGQKQRLRRSSTIIIDKGQSWAVVQLTKSQWALVDRADLDLVEGYAWYLSAQGYAASHAGPGGRIVSMHRLILGLADDDPYEPDHVNRIRTDNRRSNLRAATRSENNANRLKAPGTSSRFKGVYWDKRGKKWRAQISLQNRTVYLGSFTSEEEAARAYNQAALEAWGSHARTNDVRPHRQAS